MNTTEKIDLYIAKEGNGSIRDALNVALTRLERAVQGLQTYAACCDGCTCGDGWDHIEARLTLDVIEEEY